MLAMVLQVSKQFPHLAGGGNVVQYRVDCAHAGCLQRGHQAGRLQPLATTAINAVHWDRMGQQRQGAGRGGGAHACMVSSQ
jgi:hypothetical protein